MPNRLKFSLFLTLISAGAAILLFHSRTVFSAVPWHIEGQVFDTNTNVLAQVNISVEGTGTVKENLLGSTVQHVHSETVTDADGKFTLNVSAAEFELIFSKSNCMDEQYAFEHIGAHKDNTNQVLRITMSCF